MFNESVEFNGKRYNSMAGGCLDIAGKGVKEISEIKGLDKLTSLAELNLNKNLIEKIEDLSMIPDLESVILSNNVITEINNLDKLISLKELDLSGNQIEKIEGIENLKELKKLNLSHNKIEEIENLEHLTNLVELNLKGNKIDDELIDDLGGMDKHGNVKKPAEYVNYCRSLLELKKMLSRSTRIMVEMVRDVMAIDENLFHKYLWKWSERFGFKIDGNIIISSQKVEPPPTATEKQPAVIPPEIKEPEPVKKGSEIEILRGGGFRGGKFIYKVKVKNNSDFIINDISVVLLSFPRSSLVLQTEMLRMAQKIEPHGFLSLEFELEPQQDCVEGVVQATASYIDHLNNTHSMTVEPFPIRYVCDLLQPYKLTNAEFDNLVLNWESDGNISKVYSNVYELMNKTEQVLQLNNFYVVDSKLSEDEENDDVHVQLKAMAKGKYADKKVGMLIDIRGLKNGELSKISTRALAEDSSMMSPPVNELISSFSESGLILQQMSITEQEEFLVDNLQQSLQFIFVLESNSGVPMYSKDYSRTNMDSGLISGFISAISAFGKSIAGRGEGFKKMEYESFKIILEQGDFVTVGLILDDFSADWLEERLKDFVLAFEAKFLTDLKDWDGNISCFESANSLIGSIFGIGC
ncbi:MAG: leucine-rich repeat domain-containing protein [Candidatus Hodarchaeota archaeon]